MKRIAIFFLAIASALSLRAQDNITDSVDVLHYDLDLDIGNHTANRIEGSTAVTMRVLQAIDSITLELSLSDIDSVLVGGVPSTYSYNAPRLSVPFAGVVGDTLTVTVFYRKGPQVMSNGWGGFYFDNNIYYNLGIAIYEYPHNVGKTMFPCRDNFYDKATYRMRITAKPGWRAICSGVQTHEMQYGDGSLMTEWTLDHPTPTYLVGVAVAPFHVIERSIAGNGGISYPAIFGFLSHDSTNVWNAFDHMNQVVPMFEQCFGPYRWDRVGYVSTPMGSMEHVGNIAFTTHCMASSDESCLATMSHEFAHSWFGNLLTCSSSENMWINEGGASFCEEVAIQAICPDGDSMRYKAYADENLYNVLSMCHVRDDGFRPLYGVTPDYTYGMTVYNKGATVWHSLRGYVGDSLFYAAMHRLFNNCAFQNIDSYSLRDSLSLYCNVDLGPFFDFHVFGPGFNDYVIDSLVTVGNSVTVYLQQKNYGTNSLMNVNRVVVDFFSADMQRESRIVAFDGATASATFQLPFTPAFAVVDYDKAFSKASIGNVLDVSQKGNVFLPTAHFKSNVRTVDGSDSAFVYVAHHWSRPDTSYNPRFARMADHYWDVTGLLPETVKLNGQFHFCRTGSEGTLDNDLFSGSAEFGLVRLLYREDAGQDWRVASSMHSGNSSEGYFVLNNLKLGQYTLAVIDTTVVAIDEPFQTENSSVRIYPNPSHGTFVVETSDKGEELLIDICDSTGRTIRKGIPMSSGEQLRVDLPDGNYLLKAIFRKSNRKEVVKFQIF